MKKTGCVGHDCERCAKGPSKKQLRGDYEKEIKRLLGAQWMHDRPDIVSVWWLAPITGGMFRAGARAARKHWRPNA